MKCTVCDGEVRKVTLQAHFEYRDITGSAPQCIVHPASERYFCEKCEMAIPLPEGESGTHAKT